MIPAENGSAEHDALGRQLAGKSAAECLEVLALQMGYHSSSITKLKALYLQMPSARTPASRADFRKQLEHHMDELRFLTLGFDLITRLLR